MIDLKILLFGFGIVCLLFSVNLFGLTILPYQPVYPVDHDYTLPYCSIGTDYLNSYSDVDRWTTHTFTRTVDGQSLTFKGHIDIASLWKPYGFPCARLMFSFASASPLPASSTEHGCSVYDETKFNHALQLYADRGFLCIAGLHNAHDMQNFYGSQAMTNEWKNLVSKWKDDPRLFAVSLFEEITVTGGIDNGQGTYNTLNPSISTLEQVAEYATWLTKELHKIDPDLIVVYPWLGLLTYNTQRIITAIENTGIFNEPNVIFDIDHPYYFEYHTEWGGIFTPTIANAKQRVIEQESRISPWFTKLPSNKLYIGETFMFTYPSYETNNNPPAQNGDAQKAYWLDLINMFTKHKIGFFMLGVSATPPENYVPNAVMPTYNSHMEIIRNSNYGNTYIGTWNPKNPQNPPPEEGEIPNFILTIIGFGSIGAAIFLKEKEKRK